MKPDDAAYLREFEIEGALHFEHDEHGMARAQISTALCEATVYLHGAHVTHWQPAGSRPVLFLSHASSYAVERPIRGGIPVIFPWFGAKAGDAAAPSHGWARLAQWSVKSTSEANGEVTVVLLLDSATAAAAGAMRCNLQLTAIFGRRLTLDLTVENTGQDALHYEEALHTYFAVGDAHRASVGRLEGVSYLDKVTGAAARVQKGDIVFTAETDRVYGPTAATTLVSDLAWLRCIAIEKRNSLSTVVWNPWAKKAAALPDLADDEWPYFICVETANVGAQAIEVAAGSKHSMGLLIVVATI